MTLACKSGKSKSVSVKTISKVTEAVEQYDFFYKNMILPELTRD
jgi:hypothetical protein